MVHLQIYGQPTSTYEYIKMIMRSRADRAEIELSLEEITDWMQIINNKIPSLPTFLVNGQTSLSYNANDSVNTFINELTKQILKEENYGTMSKIIVPTDFSDAATNALVYAYSMSRDQGNVIFLTHVYHPNVISASGTVVVDREMEKIKRKQLTEFVSQVNGSWVSASSEFIPIEEIFKMGFVVEEVNKLSEEYDPGTLVVVGSTGDSGRVKKFLGSVSTEFVKNGKSTVLVVPPKATYTKIENILFGVRDINEDLKALEKLEAFTSKYNAKIHAVHIQKKEQVYPFLQFTNYVKDKFPDLTIKTHTVYGDDIAEEIDVYCQENDIDLVALTRLKRSFFSDLFHKSISRHMAIHSVIPSLIIHT